MLGVIASRARRRNLNPCRQAHRPACRADRSARRPRCAKTRIARRFTMPAGHCAALYRLLRPADGGCLIGQPGTLAASPPGQSPRRFDGPERLTASAGRFASAGASPAMASARDAGAFRGTMPKCREASLASRADGVAMDHRKSPRRRTFSPQPSYLSPRPARFARFHIQT